MLITLEEYIKNNPVKTENKDNAFNDEIDAANCLRKQFPGVTFYVGDLPGYPDIYTIDHKIGVEVVKCEYNSVYNEIDESFFREKSFIYYTLYATRMREKQKANKNINTKKLEEEYYDNFEHVLNLKLGKLNQNYYRMCKNNYLCISSKLSDYSFINVEKLSEIIDEVEQNYDKKFKGIFLLIDEDLIILRDTKFEKVKTQPKQKSQSKKGKSALYSKKKSMDSEDAIYEKYLRGENINFEDVENYSGKKSRERV